ncbi:hypothetical protein INR49_028700 [Caranx melampygus]|nr:hypothetical protein INR49_028700 [Caranx melampygus]
MVHFKVGWKYIMTEVLPDGDRVTYNMSDKNQPTLTIKDLRESDAQQYCCVKNTDKPNSCWLSVKQLHVADLQVKVFPSTEGHTVTLMCSTSCPLTKNPVNYSWYKNREYLYNDWSPWYQELVSSDDTVRYSCAVKGYEDLRAPEVSVDSVTATCINVTYAKGRMCSDKGKSDNESCSITNPTGVDGEDCWTVNYASRRICVVNGSSVNISSYHENGKNHHTLTIKHLKKTDSAEYRFRLQTSGPDLPGVTLVVTGVRVKLDPAEATEGQRITLTCLTSCPLPKKEGFGQPPTTDAAENTEQLSPGPGMKALNLNQPSRMTFTTAKFTSVRLRQILCTAPSNHISLQQRTVLLMLLSTFDPASLLSEHFYIYHCQESVTSLLLAQLWLFIGSSKICLLLTTQCKLTNGLSSLLKLSWGR